MKGFTAVYRRELAGLFLTPLAWALLCLALLVHGFFFTVYLSSGDVNVALSLALGEGLWFWVLLIVLAPLLTMRMISEEARNGVLEYLLTAPITDAAVVCGKALAATTFFVLLWSSTVLMAGVLELFGAGPDWGQIVASMVGATLVSLLFCSVGLVASAMTGIPLLAAFLAFLANVFLIMLPWFRSYVLTVSGRELFDQVIERVNLVGHLQSSFVSGAFDSADAVFFLAWSGVALFLATRLVEAKRWR